MIRWLLIGLLGLPASCFCLFRLNIMRKNKSKYSLEKRYSVLRKTVIFVNHLLGAKLNVINENIVLEKHDEGRIYACNHQAVFEVMALIALSSKPLIFISKIENSSNKLLNIFMDAIDSLTVDRDSIMQSMRVFKHASKLADEGSDIVIFAEGTRSKDGNVAKFKAGLSALMQFSNVDLNLICFDNTASVIKFNFFSLKKIIVNIKFFDKISNSYYRENKDGIDETCRSMLQNQLLAFRG